MKSSDRFKEVIEQEMKRRAEADPLFAKNFSKPKKTIDECITYILNTVRKSGRQGFADEEIYGMAAHYYDEDTIEAGEELSCKVVINQSVELSKEEIEEAKREAKKEIIKAEKERVIKRPKVTEKPKKSEQLSLL